MANPSNPMIDRSDLDHYEEAVRDFTEGRLDAGRFLYARLNLGVYTQRQEGMCMVRAKLPGGKLSPEQLEGFALCLERYSPMENVRLTTRQDIQFHYIPLKSTPQMQRDLADHAIATREAGGNTVRNITACHLAGVCPAEHVDVQGYIRLVSEYFIRHPLTQSLPRKFKIAFSGCGHDCAQGMIHDLGVIATAKEGQPGFRLLVGGGLGAKPRPAFELVDFLPEGELLPAIEALLVLHDRHSDRKRRTRNRIKFLVEKWGEERFSEEFSREFARTRSAFTGEPRCESRWKTPHSVEFPLGADLCGPIVHPEGGRVTLPLFIKHGYLSAVQLRGLARLLTEEGLEDLRVNQEQNLTLFSVPEQQVPGVVEKLKAIQITVVDNRQSVVACPGTATCPLGITNSDRIGHIIQHGGIHLNVRVNGCQNNCANSSTADVGFYGKGLRHHGTLVPSYRIQLGGSGRDGGQLAFDGPDIPAARVASALDRISDSYEVDRKEGEPFYDWSRRKGSEHFATLLEPLTQVRQSELLFLIRDLGDQNVFQVESVGLGECAGTQADPVDKCFLEARYEADLADAFAAKFKYDEAVESLFARLYAITRALFLKLEVESSATAFAAQIDQVEHLGLGRLSGEQTLEELNRRITAFQENPDEQGYPLLAASVGEWEAQVRALDLEHYRSGERRSGAVG